jgi:ferredoxin/flavodoxin---NADP+ reductase
VLDDPSKLEPSQLHGRPMGEWTQATITRRHNWTADLMTIQFEGFKPAFVPGQFFNIAIAVEGKPLKRAYSAASAPGEPLEFVVSRVATGQFTPRLFERQEGDVVTLDPSPAGFFTLDFLPSGVRDLWLIATGTGIGPYVSMLRSGALAGFHRVIFVHGVRHREQLTYADELSRPRNAVYVPTLTAPAEQASSGLNGRLPALIASGDLERVVGTPMDLDHSHFMLCGNPEMIRDSMLCLEARGMRRHKRREPGHITTEKYW